MGLSHAAMAGLLVPELRSIVVEPSFKTRTMLMLFCSRKITVKSDVCRSEIRAATHAIIATPPRVHQQNLLLLRESGFSGRLLIEKPISVAVEDVSLFDNVMSGYVLRHAHFWKLLKDRLRRESVHKVSVLLETNQDFGAVADGWRVQENAPGLSLLSEFGSHCINLMLDLIPLSGLSIISNKTNRVVLVSNGKFGHNIELKANSRDVRKSVYSVTVETSASVYMTDFYSFTKTLPDGTIAESANLASAGVHARAYLRGVEFCEQMDTLLADTPINRADLTGALETDRLLSEIQEDMRCRK